MNVSSALANVVSSVLTQTPVLLLCLIGLVWAISRWSRLPTTSLFVCCGLALRLFSLVGGAVVHYVLIASMANSGRSSSQLSTLFAVNALGWSIIAAISYGLLFAAAFYGRDSDEARARLSPPAKPV